MLRALNYFKSIFNGIIMIILDISTSYDFCGLNCQKGKGIKIYRYFETSFSCFGLFGVWGVIGLISMYLIETILNAVSAFGRLGLLVHVS